MKQPTLSTIGLFHMDDTPPADMNEDRLSKRLGETESYLCAYLVLLQRQGTPLPARIRSIVDYYGRLWDESWTR